MKTVIHIILFFGAVSAMAQTSNDVAGGILMVINSSQYSTDFDYGLGCGAGIAAGMWGFSVIRTIFQSSEDL